MTATGDRMTDTSLGSPGADLNLLLGSAPGRATSGAVADIALSHALLRRAEAPDVAPVLRLYRPGSTVAFGRVDALRPGFGAAVAAARAHAFDPVVRGPGGRAAAYHDGSLVLDVIGPDVAPRAGIAERFAGALARVVDALGRLGIEASAGQLPGEYCPGAFSVIAPRARPGPGGEVAVKLGGAAQRVVRGAWHVSVSLVVAEPDPLRRVLEDVYRRLDYPLEPSTVGAVSDIARGVTVEEMEGSLLAAWGEWLNLVPGSLTEDLLVEARTLEAAHLPPEEGRPE